LKAALASDNQSIAPSNDTQVSTVKKGRFVVKKGAVSATNVSPGGECATKAGKKPSPPQSSETTKAVKKTMNEKDATNGGRGVTVEKSKPTGLAVKGNDTKSDNTLAVLTKVADTKNPCAKKKGRFLVKTGSSANLSAMDTTAGAEIASTGTGVPSKVEKSLKQQNTSGMKSGGKADEAKGKAGDVCLDQSAAKGTDSRRNSLSSKGVDAAAASQGVKKKGRFVVKTGSAANSPAGTNAMLSPEGMQNNAIGNTAHIVQLSTPPPNPQLSDYYIAAGNIPIPLGGMPTTSLVDVNGHMMVVSNVDLPLLQTMQQHSLQRIPSSQSFVTMPVLLSSTASVGSQTTTQPQQQPQSNPCDRPRVMTEERPSDNASWSALNYVPRPNRPVGGSGSNLPAGNRAVPSGGKNGRLIGTGGVGKVLHYLETLRLEVVEADRSMASLQSDNRFLRDKNKELEAKISNLERRHAEEKCLRHTAETKYRSLRQQVSDQEMDANQHPTESGTHRLELEPTPSPDGSLIFLDGSTSSNVSLINQPVNDCTSERILENRGGVSFEDLHSITANATDQQKQQPNNKNTPPVGNTSVNSQVKGIAPAIRQRAHTGPDSKPPLSRNDSVEVGSDAAARTHHVSQSMTGLSFIAKQFDPLGTAPTSSVVHQTHGVAVTQPCIPTMTSINNENVAVPLIVTTTQPTPPPPNTGDTPCSSNVNTKKKHFDPLGTPERSHEISTSVPHLVLNGLSQMPAMATHINNGHVAVPIILPIHQQQRQNQQQDPFDEIVRMSHNSHGTI